jgi:anti-anti-sigma regulatory factor
MPRSALELSIDSIGDLAVVECEGTITRSEAAYKLRDAVTPLEDAPIIILDLSEVTMIDDIGLSAFVFLQQWAYRHRIQLKIFNPRWWVRESLVHASPIPEFDIASLDEIVALMADAKEHVALV